MDSKNIRLYKGSGVYFIEDQYQKDTNSDYEHTNLDYEDAYYHYDIDVYRILLYRKSNNEYFIRYKHLNKMDVVPLQLKIENFYNEIQDYNNSDTIYIKNSGKGFFEKIREIQNKITEFININNTPNFVQNTLDDNSEYIEADVLEDTSFVKSNCYEDKLIIVLHSVVNNNLRASLLELRKYEY